VDKFDDMFQIQIGNDSVWVNKGRFGAEQEYREEIVTKRLLDIHEQITQLKNSLGISTHRVEQEVDPYNNKSQIVDILKYTIGMAQLLGFSAEDIYSAFMEKSKRLYSIWNAESVEMSEHTKVVCIDIDGVVANYEAEYIRYVEEIVGLKPISNDARQEYSFNKRYGISIKREEQLYDEFVRGGGFFRLGLYEGAQEAIDWIMASAFIPVFVTARPNWLYKRISDDTQAWKDKHGWKDILTIFDKDKADVVINKIAPAKVVAFIEDRDKHAIEIAHLGVKVFLINRTYNDHFSAGDFKTIERVGGWGEIIDFLKSQAKEIR